MPSPEAGVQLAKRISRPLTEGKPNTRRGLTRGFELGQPRLADGLPTDCAPAE
jgi:hypothetical protein